MVSLNDRDQILETARKLPPGTDVSIFPDLPTEISNLRSKLLSERFTLPKHERKKNEVNLHQRISICLTQKGQQRLNKK